MLLKLDQLAQALTQPLSPVYIVTGDEPLLVGEAADAVRKVVKKAGYENRDVFAVDGHFNWRDFTEATASISIFADKKLLDVRLMQSKPGVEGAKALMSYGQKPPSDTLLLLILPKLDKAAMQTKWFQQLNDVGVVVQIRALEGEPLLVWLQQRAVNKGLQLDSKAVKTLAQRVEGNLLAAAQEIEKLFVLYGAGSLSSQVIEENVADNSRFDVFKLTDCLLAGRLERADKILHALNAEGVAIPVIIWAVAREIRLLIKIKAAIAQGQSADAVYQQYRLWDKRKQLISKALQRTDQPQLRQALWLAAKADSQAKGFEVGDCMETLLSLCECLR